MLPQQYFYINFLSFLHILQQSSEHPNFDIEKHLTKLLLQGSCSTIAASISSLSLRCHLSEFLFLFFHKKQYLPKRDRAFICSNQFYLFLFRTFFLLQCHFSFSTRNKIFFFSFQEDFPSLFLFFLFFLFLSFLDLHFSIVFLKLKFRPKKL